MKNVALVESGIGSTYLPIAQDVVGLVPEPKIRWNVGSLVGALLSAVTPALIVMVTNNTVAARLASATLPNLTTLSGVDRAARFIPGEGTTRIRPVNEASGGYAVTAPTYADGADPALIDTISMPQVPTYSVASLVAAILNYFESQEVVPFYAIVIDQTTGMVDVFSDSVTNFDDAVSGLIDGDGAEFSGYVGDLVANYALTPTTVTPDGETAPAWG